MLLDASVVDKLSFVGLVASEESVCAGPDINFGGSASVDACAVAFCMLGSVGSAMSVMPTKALVDSIYVQEEGYQKAQAE